MPSADFCAAIRSSLDPLSPHTRTRRRPPRVRTLPFPAHLPHLLLWPLIALGFVVIGQLARPHSLFMGFVSLRSQVCLRLPSDPASRRRPCLQLTVGAINLRKGLSPSSQRPCRAHQPVGALHAVPLPINISQERLASPTRIQNKKLRVVGHQHLIRHVLIQIGCRQAETHPR